MPRSKPDFYVKIASHLLVVSKNIEIKTWSVCHQLVRLKFQVICPLLGRILRPKHVFKLKFEDWIKSIASKDVEIKHDLSVRIWSHQ